MNYKLPQDSSGLSQHYEGQSTKALESDQSPITLALMNQHSEIDRLEKSFYFLVDRLKTILSPREHQEDTAVAPEDPEDFTLVNKIRRNTQHISKVVKDFEDAISRLEL